MVVVSVEESEPTERIPDVVVATCAIDSSVVPLRESVFVTVARLPLLLSMLKATFVSLMLAEPMVRLRSALVVLAAAPNSREPPEAVICPIFKVNVVVADESRNRSVPVPDLDNVPLIVSVGLAEAILPMTCCIVAVSPLSDLSPPCRNCRDPTRAPAWVMC